MRQALVLLGHKVNLAKPREVDLNFWANGPKAAKSLAAALKERGYVVKSLQPAVGEKKSGLWAVDVAAKVAPETVISECFTEELVRLAANLGGKFDGWGTSIHEAIPN